MKRSLWTGAALVAAAASIVFVGRTFYSVARPPGPAPPVSLDRAPIRVYGTVEPAGGEIRMGVPQAKRVAGVFVAAGDSVKRGQAILALESEVEAARLQVALARVEALRQTELLSADELSRVRPLFEGGVATESDYVSARLRHEIDSANRVAAEREAESARAALEELELRSPVDGVVYKLDVRLGETIAPDDRSRIVLGPAELHVRLFVESFWIGRIGRDASFEVVDMETNEPVGTGRVLSFSRYLGAKRLRTEDPVERMDARYQEVVLSLSPVRPDIPIGLPVSVRVSR